MLDPDRARGMLIGLAVGDALGAAVEFQRPGSFEPVTDFRGEGPHGLNPGEWTDDTSMALALADSIGAKGWDLDDQARRYLSWWNTGAYSVNGRCFDIGVTTAGSLRRFQQSGDARTAGSTQGLASGNGCIMRLAPVPIAFGHHFPEAIDQLVRRAVESSVTTHGSTFCCSATACFAVMLAALARGLPREQVLDPDWPVWTVVSAVEPIAPEVREVLQGSYRSKKPPLIRGGGFVIQSLEAALWAFDSATDFREAVLRAVNLGDDADTTGAVCGQLAGAYWGESGIPTTWRERLARQDLIENALTALHFNRPPQATPASPVVVT